MDASYQCAEVVHRAFRGSAELAKWLRKVVLATEAIAIAIAGWRTFSTDASWPSWASLMLAFVVILGICIHVWGQSVHSFAERCRRLALRAYCSGRDLSRVVAVSVESDAPPLAGQLANGLPTKTLDEYYEATAPAGLGRIKELYAHSAFYTWRLLRICWRVYASVAFLLVIFGFVVVYSLASNPVDAELSGRVLDIICSIVFAGLTAKAGVAALHAYQSYKKCREIAEALMSHQNDVGVAELATEYDIERSSGVEIPTVLYRKMRDDLQREWHAMRHEVR